MNSVSSNGYNVLRPSGLYHAIDNALRNIISEHVRIGRDILHVLILGLVEKNPVVENDENSSIKSANISNIWNETYQYDDIHVLNEFGNEYTKFLDGIYDSVLSKYGMGKIMTIYDNYVDYIFKHKDNYRTVYISHIKNILESVSRSYMFEHMCERTCNDLMGRLQSDFLNMRDREIWLNGFDWIMEPKDDYKGTGCKYIHIEFSDRVGGHDACNLVFNVNDNSLNVVWE